MIRLAKIGVPWDVAKRMSPTRRLAAIVAAGEIDGREFDWDNMRWRDDA